MESSEKQPSDSSDDDLENLTINEQNVGFSEDELKTCEKVLNKLHYRRRLLRTKKFSNLLSIGRTLFAPLTPHEKRERRRERRKEQRKFKNEHDKKLLTNTHMHKKKKQEKQKILDQIAPSPQIVEELRIEGSKIPKHSCNMLKPQEEPVPLQSNEMDPEIQDGKENNILFKTVYCHICKRQYKKGTPFL